jgi:hypothetical protein
MIRRVLSLSLVALFAFSALSARGQNPAPKAPVPSTAAGDMAGTPATAGAASPNSEAALANRVAALEKQVADLQRSNKELVNICENQSRMLRDIATGRATPDGGQRFVPNVQAIRDDRDSRRELVDTVVQGITRSTGELRIRNDMSTSQSLVVNGVDTVYVPAHTTRIVSVPSGTATTELAGEGTKSWMIGAPNYSQEVIIAPAVRTNLVTAASPWQYDPLTGVWSRTLVY